MTRNVGSSGLMTEIAVLSLVICVIVKCMRNTFTPKYLHGKNEFNQPSVLL